MSKKVKVECSGGCGKSKEITLHEGKEATWICPDCNSKQPQKQEGRSRKLFQD